MKGTKVIALLLTLLFAGLVMGCGDLVTPTQPLPLIDGSLAERWYPPPCPEGVSPQSVSGNCIPPSSGPEG